MRKSRREGDHSFNVLSGQDRVLTDLWLGEQDCAPVKNNFSLSLPIPWFPLMPEMEMDLKVRWRAREKNVTTARRLWTRFIRDQRRNLQYEYLLFFLPNVQSHSVILMRATSGWAKRGKISQYFCNNFPALFIWPLNFSKCMSVYMRVLRQSFLIESWAAKI